MRELSPDISAAASCVPAPDSQLLFQTFPDPSFSLQEQDPAAVHVAPPPAQAPPPTIMADSLEAIISRAIRQNLAQCLQHGLVPAPPGNLQQTEPRDLEDSLSEQDYIESHSSADQASVSEVDDFHE